MVRFILLDIEGTTTDIHFVHQVLFPYSARHLAGFVRAHQSESDVQTVLRQVQETVQVEEGCTITASDAVDYLLQWIAADRKHPALKTLQGMIWEAGYRQCEYQGHVYPEVPGCLAAWQQQGITLGIYSSGSVAAQQLLFAHTAYGDLTRYFSHYFDTRVGGKRESTAYSEIVQRLACSPNEILFLSDVEEELDAASAAGLQVMRVNREAEPVVSQYPVITRLDAVQLTAPLS